MNAEESKNKIIKIFIKNVLGKKPDVTNATGKHDGKYGHWLETQMGIRHNSDNAPDLLGYEMKNDTLSKTTFGDWSPDVKIFDKNGLITREDFVKFFGHPSTDKPNRWSWSGKPVPKICQWNDYGQTLEVTPEKDIQVLYDYYNDKRANKDKIIPKDLRGGAFVILQWSHDKMKAKVESKFNQYGWFKCLTDKQGVYRKIVFGAPIIFDSWLEAVRKGVIYLDSGMYHDEDKPNTRPYMQWRANNIDWTNQIVDEYPRDKS